MIHVKTSKSQNNCTIFIDFRFRWPIFFLCFFRTFYFSIFSVALPNYLIFTMNISSSLLGIIMSVNQIAYIFGPWICSSFSKKFGLKQSLIISASATFIFLTIQIIFLTPTILIIFQILDGIFSGFFWPSIFLLLGDLQNQENSDISAQNFKFYNLSWNFGLIFGMILGYLIVLIWGNDYNALILSLIVSTFLLPSAILLKQKSIVKKRESLKKNNTTKPTITEEPLKIIQNNTLKHLVFPISLLFLIQFYTMVSKALYSFTLPFFIQRLSMSSSLRYPISFFQQILLLIGTNFFTNYSIRSKKRLGIIAIIINVVFALVLSIFYNKIILIGFNIMIGLSFGILQGLAVLILLDYNARDKIQNYSVINEVVVGLGSGVTPFIVGIIIERNILLNFQIFTIISFCFLACFIFLTKSNQK